MSGDEVFVLLGCGALACILAFNWYGRLALPQIAPYPGHWRALIGLAPAAALGIVLFVLLTAAADDVRTAPQYILLYLVFGAAWVFLAASAFTMFGISVRDDALERRNPAAAIAVICAMISFAIMFSGANIGNGPGWWVVVITAVLATVAWFILWATIEGFCDAHERITVGREVPTAIRHGGLMIAMAIVLGRGAAGDWVSLPATLGDFEVAWPAPALAVIAVVIERSVLRSVRSDRNIALFLAAAYIAFAGYAVWSSPPLSHNPEFPPASAGMKYELQ
jgi:hypothetical protein